MRRGWLVVFAKAPQPGQVKTRLSPPLSPGEATELYRCLLADALEESARAAAVLDLDAVLAVDPPAAASELVQRSPAEFRALAQSGSNLGTRMSHAARQAAAAGAPCALLRGSDSPTLDLAGLREAAAALARLDVVLRPDRDGGYGLVALGPRALLRGFGSPALFDHPMSTPTALRDTLARAAQLGLEAGHVAPGFDLDRYGDLHWLAAARHESALIPCRRTLAFLDEHALWPPRPAWKPDSR